MSETEQQFQVVWFPADKKSDTRRAASEQEALRIASEKSDWAPLIQTRTVTVTDWQIIYNSVDGVPS